MQDMVSILDGATFVTSDRHGDIHGTPTEPHGFFMLDTRFLSDWRLSIDGAKPASLSIDDVNYFSKQFFLTPSPGSAYVNSTLSVIRRRAISTGMREEIVLLNHSPAPRTVDVRIDVAADFADLFEVKDALPKKGELYQRVENGHLILGYKREQYVRETWITPRGANPVIEKDAIGYTAELEPNGEWRTVIDVVPVVDTLAPPRDEPLDIPAGRSNAHGDVGAPILLSDWRPLERIYERTLEDLAALRLKLPLQPDSVLPAAGLPWFMSLFGRDSLITSYQALPFLPELSEMTLRVLANLQGRQVDAFRDMEPGKIAHEQRFGELTAFEERPHSPYYGSADSTTLWLILLDEYARWSGRDDFARELEPAARRALDWIDRYGDRDGDGFQEYERRMESGLVNQCWKDSDDSIRFADGHIASLPRATCELQGYAYDAKVRCARLARETWGDPDMADRLEREAAELKARFNREFWLDDRGYFALALDGEKNRVDSLTSNIGHLLWSGIVDEEKAARCVEHLMGPRLFSGWGVRTMAVGDRGYNPIGYHVGTVWPHDNSIIAQGLTRYGYRAEAARVAGGILDAATYFDSRLPEAFAGYPREDTRTPVEYPTSCSPQAWATGAPLLLLRAILGLEPRGALLETAPVLPRLVQQIDLTGIPGRWGRIDARVDARSTMVEALDSAAREAPPAVAELFSKMHERFDAGATKGMHGSVRLDLDADTWRVMIDDGFVTVDRERGASDCALELSQQTLSGLLHGDQNIQTVLLSGRLRATGDLALGRAFAREFLLGPRAA